MMQKLFISQPMKGKTEEEIKREREDALKFAKEVLQEDVELIDSYIAGDGVRAHMPGHKGAGPLGIEVRDITEIAGADVLSESVGILGESQKNACTLFRTGATLYSTEGSSLAVKAMLYSVMMHWKQGVKETEYSRPFILAARNVHRAMLDGCALLDLDLEFIRSGQAHGLCSAVVTAQEVEKSLKALSLIHI